MFTLSSRQHFQNEERRKETHKHKLYWFASISFKFENETIWLGLYFSCFFICYDMKSFEVKKVSSSVILLQMFYSDFICSIPMLVRKVFFYFILQSISHILHDKFKQLDKWKNEKHWKFGNRYKRQKWLICCQNVWVWNTKIVWIEVLFGCHGQIYRCPFKKGNEIRSFSKVKNFNGMSIQCIQKNLKIKRRKNPFTATEEKKLCSGMTFKEYIQKI